MGTSTELVRRSPVSLRVSSMDPIQLGEVLARSGFFQDSRDAAQATVKIIAGAEIGFGPVASMTGINVIKGRVTLSANLMAAAIKSSGKYSYRVVKHDDSRCEIEFFERGESVGVSTFTTEDAQKAGLAGDNWRKYARNMLFARALSNGAKWYCPDAFGGGPVYTPDELGAEVDGETGEAVTPMQPAAKPQLQPEADPRAPLVATAMRLLNVAKVTAEEGDAIVEWRCGVTDINRAPANLLSSMIEVLEKDGAEAILANLKAKANEGNDRALKIMDRHLGAPEPLSGEVL